MITSIRIAPSAADFIRKMLEDAEEESVLVVAGSVRGTQKHLTGNWEALPVGEILRIARSEATRLPSKLLVDYYLGTKELSRVPMQDVHMIDGIKCYLPKEMVELLGEREIVLDNGVLRFEPQLAPVEIQNKRDR